MDDLQEGAGLIRRQRHGTDELSQTLRAGRGLKDIRQGLPELDIGREVIAAKDAVLEAEVGRVLLQWGQSTESLQEMLIQVRQSSSALYLDEERDHFEIFSLSSTLIQTHILNLSSLLDEPCSRLRSVVNVVPAGGPSELCLAGHRALRTRRGGVR